MTGGLPERILEHALGQPPLLGGGRLVSIDGPAGSGKTTLADELAVHARTLLGSVTVLHMDDLYEGWQGLGQVARRLRNDVVGPLASGHPGFYRRWDWYDSAFAELHLLGPTDLLVLEGVGSGARDLASRRAVLVWVEAPLEQRLARGLARDGEAMREHWVAWLEEEQRHFDLHGTQRRADFHVDTADPGSAEERGRAPQPPALHA